MRTVNVAGHDGRCDAPYCGRPATYAKLAAIQPAKPGWGDDAPRASLGFYCSLAHAELDATAERADAERIYATVRWYHDNGNDDTHVGLWEALLEQYPQPVKV
jgi:hypothetical protein